MVFLFQRIITHYRTPVFEELNVLLNDQLVVCCGQNSKGSYIHDVSDETLPFKLLRLKNYWFGGERAVWANFLKPFTMYGRADVVIAEQSPRILFLIPLYLYCKMRRIPFILWGHGGSRRRNIVKSKSVKDIIHRILIKKADAFIAYTDGIRNELLNIIKGEKVFVATNTLDTNTLFALRQELEKEGLEAAKTRIGLSRSHYICFIGRILKEKQVDYLLDVYVLVKEKRPDTGLLIIGDGPEKQSLEEFARKHNISDIHFLGDLYKWDQSAPYLFSADVMVMPGYVGLSVNHAFCFGLPVITQKRAENGPFHSPEVEYLEHGKTGFLCENGDKAHMVDKIIESFDKRTYFCQQTLDYCEKNLSVETMVDGVKHAIDFVIENQKNVL